MSQVLPNESLTVETPTKRTLSPISSAIADARSTSRPLREPSCASTSTGAETAPVRTPTVRVPGETSAESSTVAVLPDERRRSPPPRRVACLGEAGKGRD